jgi:protein gp37
MAENSKIGWTDHTANLWWGCTEVHAGCDNCYARVLANRWGHDLWGNDNPRKAGKAVWNDLLKYQASAAAKGEMHRVFVGSMMDIFERGKHMVDSKGVSLFYETNSHRDELFRIISLGIYPNLLFLLLTKRPSNINKMIPDNWKECPPKNVMFGTSIVDQATAEKLVPQLLEVKGFHFLSMEPQIGQIILHPNWLIGGPDQKGQIDWVIQGGESGHGARPYSLAWADFTRKQCKAFNVPYFHKQTGAVHAKANGFIHDKSHGADPMDWPDWLRVQQLPRIPILNNQTT